MNDDDLDEAAIEAWLDSLDPACAQCGEDSRGEAMIGGKFYCHRDERSCYMGASLAGNSPDAFLDELKSDGWTVTFVDERDTP